MKTYDAQSFHNSTQFPFKPFIALAGAGLAIYLLASREKSPRRRGIPEVVPPDDLDQVECELWYTDRIKMSNPNWFGPFAEVPGVLMRYDVVQYGMRMRLNALSVTPGEVDPAKFDTKKEFEQVPAEVLHHELAEVLGTFAM